MQPVRVIRSVVGWTQARLAEAAGTSQPTIAAYEAEAKSPTWRTVVSVADGAGVVCLPWVGSPMTREDARSWALHQEIAWVVHADPAAARDRARRNIETMRRRNPDAGRLLDEWSAVLDGPVEMIVSQMLDPSEHGRQLRQVSPFAGLLDAKRRVEIYRAFREAA